MPSRFPVIHVLTALFLLWFSRSYTIASTRPDDLEQKGNPPTISYLSLLKTDFNAAYSWSPDFHSLQKKKYLISLIGMTAAFWSVDRELSGFFHYRGNSIVGRNLNPLAPYTNYLLPAALCGVLGGSIVHRRHFAEMSFSILEGAAVSGVIVFASKYAIGRARPVQYSNDNDEFRPFSIRYSSIPSGHTTLAFTTASIIADYYPRAAAPAYGIAVLISAQRIVSSSHWASDVLGGALLGYFLGKKISHSHLSISAERGIGIAYRF